MILTRFFLATLCLINLISTCTEGCLKCKPSTEMCQLCDGKNLYYREEGICKKSDLQNCELLSEKSGLCLICNPDYYVLNGKCVIKVTEMVFNCLIYFGSNICKKEKLGVPAYDVIFEATYISIENCLENETRSTCKKCEDGYVISKDKKNCRELSAMSDENCLIFSKYECLNCQNGFYFNLNNYAEEIRTLSVLNNTDNYLKNIYNMEEDRLQVPLITCIEVEDENCLIFESLNKCEQCKEGYFLDSALTCQKIPEPSIKNCEDYDQYLNCLNCGQGFILKNSYTCLKATEIENCVEYNGSISVSSCSKCKETHFLEVSSDPQIKNCITRSNTVEKCKSYNPEKDECLICEESFKTDSTNLNCLSFVKDCLIDNENNGIFECTQCKDGFFLSEQNCSEGIISNCKIYTDLNCTQCLNGFILNNGNCEVISNLVVENFCKQVDSTNPNKCLSCEDLADSFDIVDPCVEVETYVENCTSYNNDNICEACDEKYSLVNGKCTWLIPDGITNCSKMDVNGVDCLLCRSGYYIKNGKCLGYPIYAYQNCMETSGTDENIECVQCDKTSTYTEFSGYIGICDFANNSTYTGDIKNCDFFDSQDITKCKKCKENFLVHEDPLTNEFTCVPSLMCEKQILSERLEIDANNFYYINRYNECVEITSINNCEYYTTNYQVLDNALDLNTQYVCTKCKEGFLPLFADPKGKAHINDKDNNKSSDFLNRIYTINACIAKNIVESSLYITNENIDNCEILMSDYSIEYSKNYYICYKCKFGYTGRLKIIDNKYYISNCSPMNNCVTSKVFTGLGSLPNQLNSVDFPSVPFSTFLSCHYCLSLDQIPFFGLSSKTTNIVTETKSLNFDLYDLVGFDYNLDPPNTKAEKEEQSMEFNFCLNKNTIKSLDTTNYFPANCGAGIILIDKPKLNYIDSNTSILCIACKPGYKAKIFDPIPYAIDNCFKIPNCLNSTRFNACSECESGYVFKYDEVNQKPILDECIKSSVENCFYASESNKCNICKNGYVLHLNKSCYLMDLEHCNSDQSNKIFNYKSENVFPQSIGMFIHERRQGFAGCKNCNKGYSPVEVFFSNKKICMRNPNLYLHAGTKADSNSIDNCQLYLNSLEIKCKECKEGYIMSEDNDICFKNDNLSNCEIAFNNMDCKICSSGFFLNSNTKNCEIGTIWGCQNYSSENICTDCLEGYIYDDAQNRCVMLPNVNCESFSKSGNILTCDSCKSFYFKKDTANTFTFCLPYHLPITNCAMYNSATNECVKCEENYYLDILTHRCILRNLIENCENYNEKEDVCQKCNKGFRLVDFLKCEANPTGIKNCAFYQDNNLCKICDKDFVYFEEQCVMIKKMDLKENCMYYEKVGEEIKCTECDFNFFLNSENICMETKIKNCKKLESETKCLICLPHHSLIQENGILTCRKILLKNCNEINSFNYCIKCDNGYYPDDKGLCKGVKTIIVGCEEYLDEKSCLKCLPYRILSENRKKCENNILHSSFIDVKCESQQVNSLELCNRCKIGYYFDDAGECTKCNTSEFCLFCDSFNPDICLVCKFGSYMDKEQKCHQYVFETENDILEEFGSFLTLIWVFLFGVIFF